MIFLEWFSCYFVLIYVIRAWSIFEFEEMWQSLLGDFQAVCFVLIRPLSKNTYRRINRAVAELLWLELVWLVDWWAGVKVKKSKHAIAFLILHRLIISFVDCSISSFLKYINVFLVSNLHHVMKNRFIIESLDHSNCNFEYPGS